MNDGRGQRIELGDRVQLWPGSVGEVVCSFDDRRFGPGFDKTAWQHLEKGALFRLDDGNLVHYAEADEEVFIVERKRDIA